MLFPCYSRAQPQLQVTFAKSFPCFVLSLPPQLSEAGRRALPEGCSPARQLPAELRMEKRMSPSPGPAFGWEGRFLLEGVSSVHLPFFFLCLCFSGMERNRTTTLEDRQGKEINRMPENWRGSPKSPARLSLLPTTSQTTCRTGQPHQVPRVEPTPDMPGDTFPPAPAPTSAGPHPTSWREDAPLGCCSPKPLLFLPRGREVDGILSLICSATIGKG